MTAFVARTHEFHVSLVRTFLRDFVERLFVGFTGFEVGDLHAEDVGRPAVAVAVGMLEQGFCIGGRGVSDCSPRDEERDGDGEEKSTK